MDPSRSQRRLRNRADESLETVSVDRIGIYMAMGRLRAKEGLITMKDLEVFALQERGFVCRGLRLCFLQALRKECLLER